MNKGKLIIIGGHEDKGIEENDKEHINPEFVEQEILKRILAETENTEGCIEVITTASESYADELGKNYTEAFKSLGCKTTEVIDIRERTQAFEEEYQERIKKSSGVLFTGGDQLRLSTILGGTPFLDLIYERYHKENFVIAGTSAGAMVMSNSMIYEGRGDKAFYKGQLKITSGLGFFPGVIIDTHFIRRGRFGRLAQAVGINPSYIGIGLEEDTALVVTRGNRMETIGSGNVIIIDGHMIQNSNIISIEDGAPISINSLLVHIMAKGDSYLLNERRMMQAEDN